MIFITNMHTHTGGTLLAKNSSTALTSGLNAAVTMFTGQPGAPKAPQNGGQVPPANNPPGTQPVAEPAYIEIKKDITFIRVVASIVQGPDNNINWKIARGKEQPATGPDGQAKPKSDGTDRQPQQSIDFVSAMLDDAFQSFKSSYVSKQQESTKKLLNVLEVTDRVSTLPCSQATSLCYLTLTLVLTTAIDRKRDSSRIPEE